METDNSKGKGQMDPVRQMDEDALAYALALQSSAPRMEGDEGGDNGSEGTVQTGSEGQGVQSGSGTEGGQPSGGESGQGFLEPYLADLPEEQREIVEPVMEKFRQEQDAQVNRRFEQLRDETRVATTIHQSLIDDPIATLNWIADRMYEERGLDVRAQLKQQWFESQETQPGQGQQVQSGEENQDQPLTAAQVEEMLEQREQEREEQRRQEQFQQTQVQQQQQTVNGWIDGAAEKFKLSLDDSNGEDPLRPVIIMQANQLHEKGVARGQAAIEMAVEAVSKRFGGSSSSSGNQGGEEKHPVTANGGSPPPAKKIDAADPKQRKDRMMEIFTTSNQ